LQKKKKNVKKIEALWFESHLCAFTFLVCLTMGLEEAVWAVEFPSGAPRGGWWARKTNMARSRWERPRAAASAAPPRGLFFSFSFFLVSLF
jgi:hypothetical protein